jgi:hypothetical protein
MPFDERICRLAQDIKNIGLDWKPHVGCFVWDPDHHIKPDSPFPGRIYFILSLPRFIDLLGSIEAIVEKLVWLPTWHQARLLCQRMGVPDQAVAAIWQSQRPMAAGEELREIYHLLMGALREKRS